MKIIYSKNKINMKVASVWMPTPDWKKQVKADIAEIHGLEIPYETIPKGFFPQHTLLTDLTKEEKELQDAIQSKNLKYHIRRNQKDNVRVEFYSSEEILKNQKLIEEFRACYTEMYKTKGMDVQLKDIEIFPYIEQNAFYMTTGYVDDVPTVFHTYVDCGDRVRSWHSCSCFRDMDDESAVVVGRTNKRLHWDDLMYFKSRGYHFYDWGGVASLDLETGIDAFKAAFGGVPHTYYNGIVGVSPFGKVFLALRKLLHV